MKKILAIRDCNPIYAEELAKKINRCEDSIFHAVVFNDGNVLSDYGSALNGRIDIFLCDERLLYTVGELQNVENIVVLSEINMVAEYLEYPSIFKYQSVEVIMKEIMRFYGQKKTGDIPIKVSGDSRIISICTPVGGSFASTFSLTLALYYSQHYRTLFLSLDPFFKIPGEIKSPYESNFTDVIYYLDQGGREVGKHIESKISKIGNLSYIAGASHWFDLADLSTEHMTTLLDALCDSGKYEYLVFDVGIIGVSSLELLLASEKIYSPVGMYKNSDEKISEWKRQIGFGGHLELIDKIREIKLPYDEHLDGGYDVNTLLHGRMGRVIEEMEAEKYYRQ